MKSRLRKQKKAHILKKKKKNVNNEKIVTFKL
jgi:hypothetical protein